MHYRARWLFLLGVTPMSAACTSAVETQPMANPPAVAATGLNDTQWQLVQFESPDDATGILKPSRPENYRLKLSANGIASLQLDCNRGNGKWTATPSDAASGTFALGPVASTKMLCPPPSMGERITRDSEYVRSYLLRDGKLYLNLMADGGTYVWEPVRP